MNEQELREAFALFDVDKDGKITEVELSAVMKKLGTFTSDSDVKDMVRESDADKNGTIDFAEFSVMMTKHQRKLSLMAAFKVYDKNGDGKITAAEMQAALKELGDKIPAETAAKMMKDADANGDGVIDYSEFCKMMQK